MISLFFLSQEPSKFELKLAYAAAHLENLLERKQSFLIFLQSFVIPKIFVDLLFHVLDVAFAQSFNLIQVFLGLYHEIISIRIISEGDVG